MKKKNVIGALAAILLVALVCVPAGAQVLGNPVTDIVKPLSIKLGAFFPSNGPDQHGGGSTQFSAGLDYALSKTTQLNPTIPSTYFDYEGGTKSGGHSDVYGLGLAIRTENINVTSFKPYIGAGVGVYDIDEKRYDNGNSSNKVNVGGKVFLGGELNSGFFIEANYQILPSASGVNPSGFGAQLGYRF